MVKLSPSPAPPAPPDAPGAFWASPWLLHAVTARSSPATAAVASFRVVRILGLPSVCVNGYVARRRLCIDRGPVLGGGPDDRLLHEQVVQALGERGVARELVAAGDLVEEGAGLVDEAVVVAGPDPGGVHGQAAGDVGVPDTDDDPSEAVRFARQPAADDRELAARLTSKARAPCSQKTSNFKVFGWP
jgi:hypothetical protein